MNRLSRLSCRLSLLWPAFGLTVVLVVTQFQPATAQNSEAQTFNVDALTTVESRRLALAELKEAAARGRQGADVPALVGTLNQTAEVHLKLNDFDSALAVMREAVALARQSRDEPLLADTLTISGVVHRSRQDNEPARRSLEEAHALSLRLKYRRGEAQALMELGTIYYQQTELTKAEDCQNKALQIWRELQDKRGEARALSNLGAPYMQDGKLREAAAALEESATIWRALGNRTEFASTLIDQNFLAIRQGQWQKALSLLNEAQSLAIDKEAEPYMAGQIATGLGEVYEVYGQLETALAYFEEALILYRDYARDTLAAIDLGSKVGRVKAQLGDYQAAVQQITQGLQLAIQIKNRFKQALCHEDLGRVHLAAGLYAPARHELQEALALYQQTGNRREWARTQTFLGQAEYSQGDWVRATQSYLKALRVFQKIEDYTNEAALCFGLGKLELERHNLDQAGNYLKRSIALTEQLRENAASKDLRSSFLASVHDRYETYVEWLMQLHSQQPNEGFDVAAFEASELGRARSLLDSIKSYQRELRQTADPSLLIEEEQLQKKEQRLLDKQAQLQSEGGTLEARKEVENELTQVRAKNETLAAQINSTDKFNDLMRSTPLKLADIRQQITDSDTSLLEYSLGSQKSYLWVVNPDGFSTYELADKNTIEKAALNLANLLLKPQTDQAQETELQAAIAEVTRLVFAPAAEKLHSRRLIIVPDGILQYIPFQVLTGPPNKNDSLLAHYEIVNAPSASTLIAVQREAADRARPTKLIAGFGDPAFSSNYTLQASTSRTGETDDLQRAIAARNLQRGLASEKDETLVPTKVQPLYFAKSELNTLRKLVSSDQLSIYSSFDATRENLRKLDLQQYRILHVATHGLLNAKQPELSGLVLSLVDRNKQPVSGFVGLSDIYNLRAPVDLVVLSACHTALGKDMRGEGLIGLTRGFMYAGASSVVASLWKVDDEATAELMKRFYTNMLQDGMPPAAALRAAQNSIRQEPQWRSPYYWAAFTLQGEYRQVIKSTPAATSPVFTRVIFGTTVLALLVGLVWWYRRKRGLRTVRKSAPATRP